jgi:hypothetical protein
MTAVAHADASRRVITTTPSNQFYVRMAYACAAVAFAGFAPTYWMPLVSGTLNVPPIVHLHAVLFFGWLGLLIVQTKLAARRQLTRHRELGVVGVSLATAMVFVGIGTAIDRIQQSEAAGFGDAARAFSVVPLTGILFFAVLFTMALANVKRPDVHRRLMLIATISILNAAVGRLFILALGAPLPSASVAPPPVFITIPSGLIADLLLIPAMWHDKKRLGYVHPTYWIGGGALIASQLLRVPISESAAWIAIATWMQRSF